MDFDSLKSRFDNCEAKYLRRSVGNALNECLAEILCVRPSDPIEYMGLWLYRYADIRNYFKKKKAFYEELLTTKIDQDNKRMMLIQRYNEAVIDITAPLVKPPPPADDTGSGKSATAVQSATAQDSEHGPETEKSKMSIANDNISAQDSDVSDNSIVSRGIQPKINKDLVAKKPQEKSRQSKVVTRSSVHYSSIGYDPSHKKSKAHDAEDDDDDDDDSYSDKESLINKHYFEIEGRRTSVEVALAKWKVYGHQVFCQHPILGTISMQKKRESSGGQEKFMDTVPDFAPESMYDPELYIYDSPTLDLHLSGPTLSETSVTNIDEMDIKSTSDFGDIFD